MERLFKRFIATRQKHLPADAVLELCDEGIVVVGKSLKVVNSNARAEQIFSLAKEDLTGADIKSLLSQWNQITNCWPFSQPGSSESRLNSTLIDLNNFHLQARVKEIQFNDENFLILLLINYQCEKEITTERDRLQKDYDKSKEEAKRILEDLESQRKTLKEANELLAAELMQRARAELELSVHRSTLEKEVKERTNALVESQKKLLEKERLASLGAFAAGIAHEINNPVGAILLTIDNAGEQLGDFSTPEDIKKFSKSIFEKVATHGKRCGRIVRGILQFARAQTTEKWPDDINKVIRRSILNLSDSLPSHVAAIEFKQAENLPLLQLNPTAMEQAIINIVKNSIEAADGKEIQVKIRTFQAKDTVLVEIEDTGKGMTEEQQLHLFDPFYTTRLTSGGTGLGLSIVHGIVQEHGAVIRVKSEVGVGTTMTIEFPVQQVLPE